MSGSFPWGRFHPLAHAPAAGPGPGWEPEQQPGGPAASSPVRPHGGAGHAGTAPGPLPGKAKHETKAFAATSNVSRPAELKGDRLLILHKPLTRPVRVGASVRLRAERGTPNLRTRRRAGASCLWAATTLGSAAQPRKQRTFPCSVTLPGGSSAAYAPLHSNAAQLTVSALPGGSTMSGCLRPGGSRHRRSA